MNATPMTPSAAATLQGTPPSRKGEPAPPDTPFSRILSGEMAQQAGAEASVPHDAKDLAARLAKLFDSPADPATTPDPSLALQTAADPASPLPAAETLLGMNLSFTSATGNTPASSAGTQADAALDPDAVSTRPLPGNAVLRAPAEPADTTRTIEPGAGARAGTAGQTSGSEAAGGLFAARLAADSARAAETPAELLVPAGLRPAAAPTAAETGPVTSQAGTPNLSPKVGSSAWGEALGEKIVWMASGRQQSASLTLNPPNLGPLQVVLNVSSDQATANFYAAQPEVRQAIEAALPRLREMMGDAGIQLGQASVSADTPGQDPASGKQDRSAPPGGALAEADAPTAATPAPRMGRGLVDTFA